VRMKLVFDKAIWVPFSFPFLIEPSYTGTMLV
jgi:hypothetical protein